MELKIFLREGFSMAVILMNFSTLSAVCAHKDLNLKIKR